jgi:hypothetical protein
VAAKIMVDSKKMTKRSFLSQTSTSSKLQNGFDKNSIIEERDKLQLQVTLSSLNH